MWLSMLVAVICCVNIEVVTGRSEIQQEDNTNITTTTNRSLDIDKLISALNVNTSCVTQVTEEAWKKLLPFLQGVVRIEDVCLASF